MCWGEVAVIEVSEFTVTLVAALVENETAVAPVKPVPPIVTEVPPDVGPKFGLTDVTVGGARNVNWSALEVAEVPFGVVTVMSTVPGASAGDVAEIDVAELTVKPAAAVPPKLTALAPVRFVPVMVTAVPPAAGPLPGLTEVTVGAVGERKLN
jgi:hypothetical protein